jgi:predicted sulfurtransferase
MSLFTGLSAAALLLLCVVALTACNSMDRAANGNKAVNGANQQAKAGENTPGDGVRRVTTVELRNMLEKGEAVPVDVRGDSQWEAGHIKGAIHLPTNELLAKADQLPRDKTLVTYCS